MKKQSSSEDPLISAFKAAYNAQPGFTCTYAFTIDEKSEPLVVDVNGMKLSVSYDKTVDADISLRLSSEQCGTLPAAGLLSRRLMNR